MKTNTNKRQAYIRNSIVSLNIVSKFRQSTKEDRKPKEIINGKNVKVFSLRLLCFKKSLVCVTCGIVGKHFALECDHGNKNKNYHLNLYAINDSGDEILMTKDHIKPKSKGGKDSLGNLQTMCYFCNQKKDNKY